jgi:hypothetical protein
MSDRLTVVVWESWVPAWSRTIKARYTPLVKSDDGLIEEPQHIECECLNCKAVWKQDCISGMARNHIQNFAHAHMTCKEGSK